MEYEELMKTMLSGEKTILKKYGNRIMIKYDSK